MRWSEIKGTTYILSDSGIVRNTKTGKVLKPKARKYPTVTLFGFTFAYEKEGDSYQVE